MNREEEVNQLNAMIKDGLINADFSENYSILAAVWGIYKMQYKNLIWQKNQSHFLGGGIYDYTWYILEINGTKIKRDSREKSLHLFLHYVMTH